MGIILKLICKAQSKKKTDSIDAVQNVREWRTHINKMMNSRLHEKYGNSLFGYLDCSLLSQPPLCRHCSRLTDSKAGCMRTVRGQLA